MRNTKNIVVLAILAISVVAGARAFAPTNFFTPWDPALRLPPAGKSTPFRIGVNMEYGDTHNGRNWDDKKRNVLRLYDETQAAIPALEQPSAAIDTPDFENLIHQLRIAGWRPGGVNGGGAWDDGTRGHLLLNGKFEQFDVTPHMRYILPFKSFPGSLALSAHLPIRHAEIDNVSINDLTGSNLTGEHWPVSDYLVEQLMTSDIKGFAKRYGNLDLNNWSATDLGDLVLMMDWGKDFPQTKEDLKNVELHLFLAVSCPTGLKRDEDKAFSMALGNDGAWSLPFGIGIDMDFKYHIALGAEAQFEVIFDKTKTYRMKTHDYQTEFLLLNKGRATMDHGFFWKFYLYLQGYHFWRGLSLKAAYEYIKHDSDRLTPKTDDFSAMYANGARSLGEWYNHEFIFSLNYDFFEECKMVKPQFSFFYKLPVAGKKIINPQTFGGQLAINF